MSNKVIEFRFGAVTASEVDVMLTASAESGTCPMATYIQENRRGKLYRLTPKQALWLGREMCSDADRVAQSAGDAAGRAFETAGEKLISKARATLQPILGRKVVSGAYGTGTVIGETAHTLTLRLCNKDETEVTINKAGNIHFAPE